ncbi:DMT family transporter [Haloferula rosea]|uniref:EamA family transporter n=1 Tax=Haloferula rosea TaxID=490093 RepID=A0A934RCA8_9BACT|nr:DMT family transporter [Haloferula rosea]MBK1828038.1 EamA family transporter [Haloferula rosea]
MSWLLLSIASAVLLGLYDYFKKLALKKNDVVPVLAGSVFASSLVWLPFAIWSAVSPDSLPHEFFDVGRLTAREHLLLWAKAALVGASWVCGYCGIKRLPLSIAAPIRATGPLWTIALAVLVFAESPTARQWLGISIILTSFFAFSLVGRREGIRFHRDKGVFLMIGATVLGAVSALYDKFLIQSAGIPPSAVQAWFTMDMAVLLLPAVWWWMRKSGHRSFCWHWSVPVIGLSLLAADILYFIAISQPDALISLISPVRRTSVVVSFLLGIIIFRERQGWSKAVCVVGIVTGVLLLS